MCDYSKWDKFSDADSDNSDCEGQGGLFSGLNRFVKSLGPGAGGEGAPPLWSEGPNGVPEALEQTLRFGVGDKVEVLVGENGYAEVDLNEGSWFPGAVVHTWCVVPLPCRQECPVATRRTRRAGTGTPSGGAATAARTRCGSTRRPLRR